MRSCRPSLAMGKPLDLTANVMEGHESKRRILRGLRSMIKAKQVTSLWGSKEINLGFSKSFTLKQTFPKHILRQDFCLELWNSHRSLASFLPSYLSIWLLSLLPPHPRAFPLLRKGDQVMLKRQRDLFIQKRNMTLAGDSPTSNPVLCSSEKKGHYRL